MNGSYSVDVDAAESLARAFNAYADKSVETVNRQMDQADQELGTFGVEAVKPEGAVYPTVLYCNTGETYAATLVYDVAEETFYVASWGDVAEEKGY